MSQDIEEYSAMEITEDILFREWLKSIFNQTFNYSHELDPTMNEELRVIFRTNVLNMTGLYPELLRERNIRNALIIIFYSIIIFLSFFGNFLVCKVILSRRRLRIRTTNILILNLSISDLFMTLSIPVTVARLILDDWPLGSTLCILAPFIQVTSVMVSTLSMAIIAVDRYQVIVNPLKTRICSKVPKWVIILVIWLTAGILAVPHSIFNRSVEMFGFKTMYRCRSVYPEPDQDFYKKLFTITTISTQYLIPLLTTLFIYGLIAVKIYRRAMVGEMTAQQFSQRLSSKKKTIKMLLIVVIVFAVCWLPINLYHFFNDLLDFDGPIGYTTYLVCHWLAFSSVCWNPFIYFGLNQYYRQGLKNMCLFRNLVPSSGNNSQAMSTRSTALLSRTNSRTSERKFNISLFRKSSSRNKKVSVSSLNNSLLDRTSNRCSPYRCQTPNGRIQSNNNSNDTSI